MTEQEWVLLDRFASDLEAENVASILSQRDIEHRMTVKQVNRAYPFLMAFSPLTWAKIEVKPQDLTAAKSMLEEARPLLLLPTDDLEQQALAAKTEKAPVYRQQTGGLFLAFLLITIGFSFALYYIASLLPSG